MGATIQVDSASLGSAAVDLSAAATRLQDTTGRLGAVFLPVTGNGEFDQALFGFHNAWALYDLPQATDAVTHLGTALGLAARGYAKAEDAAMRLDH